MNVAVVSGGTRGLGRALCLELGRRGYHVVALYHADDESAEALRSLLADEALPATVHKGDIAEPAFAARIALSPEVLAAERLVLVNNASASFQPQPFHLVDDATLARLLDTVVTGSFNLSRALLRPLLRGPGALINVLSAVVTPTPAAGFSAYTVAKHGLLGLTRALASEYGRRGLKVFSVSPGYMETSLTAAWHPEMQRVAAARAVSPASVARQIATLIDDPALIGTGEDHGMADDAV